MTSSAEPQPTAYLPRRSDAEREAQVIPIRSTRREPDVLDRAIEDACRRIAPLYPLKDFVAVNAFLGFSDTPFPQAAREIDRLLHGRPLMPLAFYARALEQGRIDEGDLREAFEGSPWAEPGARAAALRAAQTAGADAPSARMETPSEAVDGVAGRDWSRLIANEISRWCSARFDAGQGAWKQPLRGAGLFEAWRAAASVDRNPELLGLRGFRSYVTALPASPREAIRFILAQLEVPADVAGDLLTRALASIAGWAGHVQMRLRDPAVQSRAPEELVELLAIRMAFEGALHRALGGRLPLPIQGRMPGNWGLRSEEGRAPASSDTWELRLRLHEAYEAHHRRALLRRLQRRPDVGAAARSARPRPALQAAFCIDVRSEPLRRHLEAMSSAIETIGFAGFFGIALESVSPGAERGSARCPALLEPGARVRDVERPGSGAESRARRARARHERFAALRKLSVGAYPLVETLGHFFGLRLVSDSLGWTRVHEGGALFADGSRVDLAPRIDAEELNGTRFGLTLEQQIDFAQGALTNMGLTRRFAEVVLLCGHGSSSTNNPYAAGLDCGACGGHPGDVNARVAAAVLGDPAVRKGLAERGIEVPDDTVFVAGLHDTTLDEVRLFDDRGGLSPAQRARLEDWLREACAAARDERAPKLKERPGPGLARRLRRRSRDWSEARPEWGLAGNAAFIAAPRGRTRGVDLEGRAFLHDYDPEADPEGRVLELILTAPLVVASWINLQYFASTVDNERFGSGHKALHNVSGRLGVQLGNQSDLQVGLPWQSVHDGERYVHEPMRLTAIVEAPRPRIDDVLARHEHIRQLVEHEWIHLFAFDAERGAYHRRTPDGWRRVETAA